MMLKLVTNEMGILMDEQLGTGEVREVRKGKTKGHVLLIC
jgi:hypothetical protein